MITKLDTSSEFALLDQLSTAVMLLDNGLRIVYLNAAAEQLLSASMARTLGKRLVQVVNLSDALLARLRDAVESGQPFTDRQAVIEPHGLEAKVVDIAITPQLTDNQRRGLLIEVEALDRPLRIAKDEAILAQQEHARSLLRGLAHEIKNPLSAIRGASQLLARRVKEKDKALTDMITGETDRIAELIDRMQQLGSKPAAKTGPCNLHQSIRNAMATVRAAQPDGVPLVEEFDPSLPPVEAEQGGLEQVLINLITNASDACSDADEPQVTVKTRYVSGMRFSALRLGKSTHLPIEIAVSDNGPGVPADLRDHLFEPFVSGKTNGQGLGLALVRKLIRDMGGRISHDRNGRAGRTIFRVNLPVAEKQ